MGSKKQIKLTLSQDGEILLENEIKTGCEPLVIGRSRSCAITTPPGEHSISGKHARVFWKGSSLYIEDTGSRNGVSIMGRRLDRAEKVEFQMPYALGKCQLVFAAKGVAAPKPKYWQLEFLNGERAKEAVRIIPKKGSTEFTIGSDPSNDVAIDNKTISSRHARIVVKPDGSCWLVDNGSTNHTKVNGDKLPPDRERLLKDGDRISLSFYNFMFHDPAWKPTSPAWKKVVTCVVTVLLLVAGWQLYKILIVPAPTDYLKLATRAAYEERFEDAEKYIDSAIAEATGAEEVQAKSVKQTITIQKNTHRWWKNTLSYLTSGNLYKARSNLEQLVGEGSVANWNWNNKSALEAHETAKFCKTLFDVIGDPQATLDEAGKGVGSIGFIKQRIGELDAYLAANKSRLVELGYLDSAVDVLKALRAKLQTILDGIAAVDNALSSISYGDTIKDVPDFAPVVRELERVASDGELPAGVQKYAKDLLPICRNFVEVRDFIVNEKMMIADMKFDEVRKIRNDLPVLGSEECAINKTLSSARDKFRSVHEGCLKFMATVAPMMRNLEAIGVRNSEKGHTITVVADQRNWQKVLAFDCFGAKFPLPSRVDPTSTYDEIAGIEYTYENLRELPKPLGRKNSVTMNFVPKCQNAKAAFDQVRTFLRLMEREDSAEFRVGRLGAMYALGAEILSDRDALVAFLKGQSAVKRGEDRDRTKIVAGYYAEYFSEEPSYADLRSLEMSFKKLQKKVSALNERYDAEADPEKRLAIKKEIIAIGIPGMEPVRRVWVDVD